MTYGGITDPNYTVTSTIFVSPSGSDSNSGLTEALPRLFSAATLAMGGAGVGLCCLDGTYVGGHTISHGGNADTLTGYFAIFSKNPRGAKFVPDPAHPTFNLFDLTASTASYIILDGLDIQGPLPSVTGGSAIEFKSHHLKILDCGLHDSAACGLQAAGFDYLLLQGCDIYSNAGSGNGDIVGGGYSGVSLLGPIAFDDLPGWHVVARFNRIWNNIEGPLVTVAHSDGNGLILDSWGSLHGYGSPTLIEGNLVVGNGRRGIEVLKAYQGGVSLISNTCCNNNQDTSSPGTVGEIAVEYSLNTVVANNIMDTGGTIVHALVISNDSNSTILTDNLTFNGTPGQASYQAVSTTTTFTSANGNLPGVDPQLAAPTLDVSGDFRPKFGSPVLGAGTLAYGYSATDILGNPRVVNNLIDIGAYQGMSVLPQTQAIINAYKVPPTTARIAAIDAAAREFVTLQAWSWFDVLYMRAADPQSWTIEWKNPGAHTLVQFGTVCYTVDGGASSDGVTGYYDSLYNPSTFVGSVYKQNYSHIGVWVGNNPTPKNGQDVSINPENFSLPCAQVNSRSTINRIRGAVNDETAIDFSTGTITDSSGHTVLSRTLPGVTTAYKNGVATSIVDTTASIGVPNGDLFICGTPMYSLSNRMESAVHAGSGLNAMQVGFIETILWSYMNTVGGAGTAPTPTPPFPTAFNTGYGNTTLTPSIANNITAAGTYSGLDLTGVVQITASNVTFENCRITANSSDPWSLGVSGTLTNVVIKNIEIVGAGLGGPVGSYGIYCESNAQVTIQGCNIHDCGQAIVMNDGQVTIKANYIHDLNASGTTHYECIGYFGAGTSTFSLDIEGNTLINQNNQTAAVFLQSYFGKLQNITVNANLMVGGDYTLYVDANPSGGDDTDPVTNVNITNNACGAGIFGYFDLIHGSGSYGVTITGNYDWITHAPVP